MEELLFKNHFVLYVIYISIIPLLSFIHTCFEKLKEINRTISFFKLWSGKKSSPQIQLTGSTTDLAIQEIFENKKFQRVFGFYIESAKRELLIEFHKKHELELTWDDIKAAYSHLTFENGNLKMRISRFDKVFNKVNYPFVLIMILCGIFILIFTLINIFSFTTKEFLGFSAYFIYFLSLGMIMYNLNLNFDKLLKVEKAINKKENVTHL